MKNLNRIYFLAALTLGIFVSSVTTAYGQQYFTFQNVPTYMKGYFEKIDRYASNPNVSQKSIQDEWKTNMEQCFLSQKGRILPTGLSSGIKATLVSSFALTDASGNVGRSAAVPYAVFTAKISGGDQMVLGYICRDIKGVPMYVGKTTLSGGEATITIKLGTDASRVACIALANAIGRIKTVQLLTEEELEAHVLYCTGPSYNKKGFGGVYLGDTQGAAPLKQETLYDNKLTETIEEEEEGDVYSITRMTLSKKGEPVAIAYLGGDNGEITSLEIVSPDIFILPALNPYAGCVPLHIESDPALLLSDNRSRAIVQEDDYYYTLEPYIKLGVAWYSGFLLKDSWSGGSSFNYDDLSGEIVHIRLILHE